jgi:PD-(D/E)XK endonuclease
MPNNSRVPHHPSEGCDSSIRHPKIDTKRLGEVAELAFLLKATSLHLTPARPFGDRRPYDFLLECGERVLRIQVKCVSVPRPNNPNSFAVNVVQHKHGGRAAYTSDDIDFLVAYVLPHDTFYVIPVDVLNQRKMIVVYPIGKKRSDGGLFENYREAWHLLTPRGLRASS